MNKSPLPPHLLLVCFKRFIALFVVFLLAQVCPAEEEAPKSPQGVELLFPENNGAAVKDKKKNDKAEKAAKRQAALLKKLKAIEKGGDINAVDKEGQTALMLAAASNNRLVVSWLVAKGADVTLKSEKGKTAYDLTKSKRIRDLLRACLDEKKPLDEEQKKDLSRSLYEGTDKDAIKDSISKRLTAFAERTPDWDDHFYRIDTTPKTLSGMQRFVGDLRGVKTFPLRTPESTAFLVRHGGSSPIPEELVEVESLTLRLLLALGEDAKANDNERKMQVALKIGSVADIKSLLNEESSLAKNTKLYNYIAGATSMQTLLDAGVDAKSEWEDEATKKKTNFIALAMKNFDAGMLRVLIKAGVTLPDPTNALFYPQNKKDAEDQEYALALLTAGGDVKAYMSADALHLAAAWSMPKVAKALLDAGANPNAPSKEDTKDNDTKRKTPSSPVGVTPLMDAAYAACAGPDCTRRADVVKVLLDAGADARTKDSDGHNALSYVLDGGHRFGLWEGPDGATYRVSPEAEADILRAAELLIQAGAEAPKDALLSGSRDELSPAGKEKLALMLLAHGADPKAVDESGWTTLMRVGIYGGKIAKSLLDAGVDPTVTVQSGEQKLSALSLAMDAGAADVVEQLKKKGIEPGELTSISNPQSMKKLLDLGARIPKNMTDMLLQDTTGGHSYEPRKTYEDYVQIIRSLKKHGYSPTLEGIKEIPHYNIPALRALLKEGANPNALTESGEPLLIAACSTGWDEARQVAVLLEAGVKTDVKNKNGKTALQIAREKKNEELVKLLEEHGVKE